MKSEKRKVKSLLSEKWKMKSEKLIKWKEKSEKWKVKSLLLEIAFCGIDRANEHVNYFFVVG